MKYIKICFLFITLICLGGRALGQDTIIMDWVYDNGGNKVTCDALLYDDGGPPNPYDLNNPSGLYQNQDRLITLCPGAASGAGIRMLFLDTFDVTAYRNAFNPSDDRIDFLYVYDGPDTNASRMKFGLYDYLNNDNKPFMDSAYVASQNNTSGCLTFYFKSDTTNGYGIPALGWKIKIDCRFPCQEYIVTLKDSFLVVKPDGELVQQAYVVETDEDGSLYYADICLGDSIFLPTDINFLRNNVFYDQSEDSLYFRWQFGDNDTNTIKNGWGITEAGVLYKRQKGYTLSFNTNDQEGCVPTDGVSAARVRIARSPIKEVMTLPNLCTEQSLEIKAGSRSDIVVEDSYGVSTDMKKFEQLTFIPDGGKATGGVGCYNTTVEFTDFGNAVVESEEDICSICIKMEHSWVGDLTIRLICPTGQSAYIKEMTWGSGGYTENEMLGIPYGGGKARVPPYDNDPYWDETVNLDGIPWNYCWSFNNDYKKDYRYVIDSMMHQTKPGLFLDRVEYQDTNYSPAINSIIDSSNYNGKSGFFEPENSFKSLIGCELNGKWTIEICDVAEDDNGWIQEWSLDLCNSKYKSWTYSVNVRDIVWSGEGITQIDSITGQVYHTAPGTYEYTLSLVDDFGCVWDTTTTQKVVQSPKVSLQDDSVFICGNEIFTLDAGEFDVNNTYSYRWNPGGETTPVINTLPNVAAVYTVEVTDVIDTTSCSVRDSVIIAFGEHPKNLQIEPDKKLEGCEPLEIFFENFTEDASAFRWDFGDGSSSDSRSPEHTFNVGKYNVIYYATGKHCTDTIEMEVNVFSTPKADFYWEPIYPTVKEPVTQFINKTEPLSENNIYLWKIQIDKSNPNSLKYLRDSVNLFYQWNASGENLVHGVYAVELKSSTENYGPSGDFYECADSMRYEIRILNDFLQFPNVVTPNGDGVNDIFQIKSLVEGMAYPQNELTIFDRTGKRVFHKKNIQVESDFWDPKATNTPPGTYFYRFVGKGYINDVEYKGSVEVLIK